jgi:hypothetical protein
VTSRQVWLHRVAEAAAGNLGAGWAGEILGMTEADEDAMTDAERARLAWAVAEVQRRLYRMGRDE